MSTKRSRAWRVVENLMDIAEILKEERKAIEADPGSDATGFAGELAAALLENGARIADRSPHPLRWAVNEQPTPLEDPEAFQGALATARVVLEALEYARRHGPGPDQEIRDAAFTWPKARNKAEGDALVLELARARADGREAEVRAAHAARIDAAQKKERAKQASSPGPTLPVREAVTNVAKAVVDAALGTAAKEPRRVAPPDPPFVPPELPVGKPGRPDGAWAVGEIFDLPFSEDAVVG